MLLEKLVRMILYDRARNRLYKAQELFNIARLLARKLAQDKPGVEIKRVLGLLYVWHNLIKNLLTSFGERR